MSPGARESCDVAVVGAGPAGALAARQLAMSGLSVVLIDKASFPRDKVCGCCLSASALSTLASVGLGEVPASLGARSISALHLAAPRARACLPVRGASLSRFALDLALAREAASAGARFLPQTLATLDASGELLLRSTDPGCDERSMLQARTILVADGLAGSSLSARPELTARVSVGSRIGVSTILPAACPNYPADSISMTIGAGGYVGGVRLEDRRLNVAAALDPAFIRECGGPGPAIASLLASAGMPSLPALEEARFHATPTLTRRRPVLDTERVLILGDAAGYVEPFTGEGMAWALASAVAVVPEALARAGNRRASRSWSRTHRRLIAPRQRLCRALSWTLRHPRLVAPLIRALSIAPFLARPALGSVASPFSIPEPAP